MARSGSQHGVPLSGGSVSAQGHNALLVAFGNRDFLVCVACGRSLGVVSRFAAARRDLVGLESRSEAATGGPTWPAQSRQILVAAFRGLCLSVGLQPVLSAIGDLPHRPCMA